MCQVFWALCVLSHSLFLTTLWVRCYPPLEMRDIEMLNNLSKITVRMQTQTVWFQDPCSNTSLFAVLLLLWKFSILLYFYWSFSFFCYDLHVCTCDHSSTSIWVLFFFLMYFAFFEYMGKIMSSNFVLCYKNFVFLCSKICWHFLLWFQNFISCCKNPFPYKSFLLCFF